MLSGLEYLQSAPEDADLRKLFADVAVELGGKELASLLAETNCLVSEYNSLSSGGIDRQPYIIARPGEINGELGKLDISTFELDGWLKRMEAQISVSRQLAMFAKSVAL